MLDKSYTKRCKKCNGKEVLFNILYKKEKAIIKQLIQNRDFEGLRVYLLELEKEENK